MSKRDLDKCACQLIMQLNKKLYVSEERMNVLGAKGKFSLFANGDEHIIIIIKTNCT